MKRKTVLTCSILTLNCFGVPFLNTRPRLEAVGRELNQASNDFLCFQEVQLWRYLPMLTRTLTNYPHRAYEPFIHAPKGGLLTVSRHPIVRHTFELYHKRGRIYTPAIADWVLHKGILTSELVVQNLPISVVNTHLIANYNADWSRDNPYTHQQRAELEQLERALARIDQRRLVVLVGDFNIPTDTTLYQDFVRSAGLIDPLAGTSEPTYRPRKYFPEYFAQPIDHVLVRAPCDHPVEVSAHIVFRHPVELGNGRRGHVSDHLGIASQVQVLADE